MILKGLTISHNNASYPDWIGTPPGGYSGKIEMETKVGTVSTVLTESDVRDIINVVAERIARDMVELSKTVTNDIRLSVENKAIEVDG